MPDGRSGLRTLAATTAAYIVPASGYQTIIRVHCKGARQLNSVCTLRGRLPADLRPAP